MIALSANPAALEAASRMRTQMAPRTHRLGEPEEIQEDTMPTGQYVRKPKASATPAAEPEAKAEPRKRGRKAKVKPQAASQPARFGVFDDGSVTLNLPACKGQLVPQEAREFLAFLARIGVKA